MTDFNIQRNLEGYQRDEYRVCALYWGNATKHLIKLQKEYEKACKEPITFSYLHSADFDCYGNLIPNVHAKEKRKRVRIELEKLRNENKFLKSLSDSDFELVEYRPISTYEAHFSRKVTNRLI